MGMQKDHVEGGVSSGVSGVSGVGVSGVGDVAGDIAPPLGIAKQQPLLDQIPAMRPEVVESRITTPMPKKIKKKVLSKQEWIFVREFVTGDGEVTLKEAARRAGYKETNLEYWGRRLTDPHKSPHIVAAIQELRTELATKHGTTFERHMRDMQRIRDQALAAGAYSAAVAAEYRRGQALGTIYVERKEIRVGTIDSMSKEEVLKKLQELHNLYGQEAKTVDVQAEWIKEMNDAEKVRKGLVQRTSFTAIPGVLRRMAKDRSQAAAGDAGPVDHGERKDSPG
jgi:predicted transcriptional regulator